MVGPYTDKITRLTEKIVVMRCGNTATSQRLALQVRRDLKTHCYTYGVPQSVKQAAQMFRELQERPQDVIDDGDSEIANMIVAGYDERMKKGQVCSILP